MPDFEGYLEGEIKLATPASALEYFSRWGRPVVSSRHREMVRCISPRATSEAPKRTLSSRYGFAAFPFHTDGAHWPQPPRYLVLYCRDPGDGERETLLSAPLESITCHEETVLRRATWRVDGVRKPFVVRILDGIRGHEYVRFDQACMTPMSDKDDSRAIIAKCIARKPSVRVSWQAYKFLIIDNWRVLHSRGSSLVPDPTRLHWRILLE